MDFCRDLPCPDLEVDIIANGEAALKAYMSSKVTAPGREHTDDPFYVVDLGQVIELHQDWVTALPTVTPFYAIKCNNDPVLLETLAALGTGFDCASKYEIKSVLDLGVPPDHIVYANPCKQISHLKYAATVKVETVMFDGEEELYKTHEYFPSAKLVLRLKADDPEATFKFGVKYGCSVAEGKDLLKIAQQLRLDVIGVCFHVGTGAQSPGAYEVALRMAAELFEAGYEMDYRFSLLDIGGGFPGDKGSKEVFQRVTSAINSSLTSLFSSYQPGLTVIAEPGTYFACSTHKLASSIMCKKANTAVEHKELMYYVNDGLNGSLDLFRNETPKPFLLKEVNGPLYPTCLWGPTLSPNDKLGDVLLPELNIGDWICFQEVGAYSLVVATNFNGFPKTRSYYYVTRANESRLRELLVRGVFQQLNVK